MTSPKFLRFFDPFPPCQVEVAIVWCIPKLDSTLEILFWPWQTSNGKGWGDLSFCQGRLGRLAGRVVLTDWPTDWPIRLSRMNPPRCPKSTPMSPFKFASLSSVRPSLPALMRRSGRTVHSVAFLRSVARNLQHCRHQTFDRNRRFLWSREGYFNTGTICTVYVICTVFEWVDLVSRSVPNLL